MDRSSISGVHVVQPNPEKRCSALRAAMLCAGLAAILIPPLLMAQTAEEILARPDVRAEMEAIRLNEPHFVDEQIRIYEIAAPDFHDDARAAEMARLFREAGLNNVRIDKAGNVLGDRPGSVPHPHLVIAAHLDTVFPAETDVHVTRTGNC